MCGNAGIVDKMRAWAQLPKAIIYVVGRATFFPEQIDALTDAELIEQLEEIERHESQVIYCTSSAG